MRRVARRPFLRGGALLAGFGALPFAYTRQVLAEERSPLVADPDGIMDLPAGFAYRILEQAGEAMSDGYRVPALADGMGCFPQPDGNLVLMRNHELSGQSSSGPYLEAQPRSEHDYDAQTDGSVTRLVVDGVTFERRSSNLVLVGTTRNCSGGTSPWGWLSAEEVFSEHHGYVFLCDPAAEGVMPPRRITSYGHFYHEAAVVDPATLAAYLTEDRSDGCLFRFLPDDASDPFFGRLQALAVRGRPGFSTSRGLVQGDVLDVGWVDLPDPDPPDDVLRRTAFGLGAASINRGEGIWCENGRIYFTATAGGEAGVGQVFALQPAGDRGELVLVAESDGVDRLDGPDCITVAPWGDLIVSEDSVTGRSVNHVLGITPEGEHYHLARTLLGEISGLCFAPGGRALFLNIFNAGLTLVITGPFPGIPIGEPPAAGNAGEAGVGASAGADADAGAGGRTGEGGAPGHGGASRSWPNAPGRIRPGERGCSTGSGRP
jgi:uncharacterized protein